MKPLPMPSLDEINKLVSYDKETGDFMWKIYRGGKAKANTKAGSLRPDGYLQLSINYKGIKLQRLAWYIATGNDPLDMEIDHINGIKTDNRLCNLRIATEAQNCFNRKKRSDNTSGYKGVTKMRNKWAAAIAYNKTRKFLGIFETPLAAYIAYQEASKKYHGDFSNVN